MSLVTIALVLLSALAHVGWNLLVKVSPHKAAFMWWALLSAVVLALPFAFGDLARTWNWAVAPVLVVSGLFEVGYIVAVTRAYDLGDLSLVYPLARGSAPVFTVVGGLLLFSDHPTPVGYLGVGVIVLGIGLASRDAGPSPAISLVPPAVGRQLSGRKRQVLSAAGQSVILSLLGGLCLAGYSLSDKYGMTLVSPLPYNFWLFLAMVMFLTPYVWRRSTAWTVWQEWRGHWWRMIGGGVLIFGAYIFVLQALAMAPAGYVIAVRGVGVVFSAVLGWLLLHESFGLRRVLAALLMAAGVACLAVEG